MYPVEVILENQPGILGREILVDHSDEFFKILFRIGSGELLHLNLFLQGFQKVIVRDNRQCGTGELFTFIGKLVFQFLILKFYNELFLGFQLLFSFFLFLFDGFILPVNLPRYISFDNGYKQQNDQYKVDSKGNVGAVKRTADLKFVAGRSQYLSHVVYYFSMKNIASVRQVGIILGKVGRPVHPIGIESLQLILHAELFS